MVELFTHAVPAVDMQYQQLTYKTSTDHAYLVLKITLSLMKLKKDYGSIENWNGREEIHYEN